MSFRYLLVASCPALVTGREPAGTPPIALSQKTRANPRRGGMGFALPLGSSVGEVAKHYRGKFKATKRQADAAVAKPRANGELVQPVTVPLGTVRDKDDLPVVGMAVAGSAAVFVTGDQELLALGLFRGVAILSPRDFYERLRE
jgi:hypothetical protein